MKKLLLSLMLLVAGFGVSVYADSYKLVTDASTLADGDEVLVVGKNDTNLFAATSTVTSTKIKSIQVSASDNTITLPLSGDSQPQILVLKEGTTANTFALQQKGTTNFIIGTANNSTDTKYGTGPVYDKISINAETAAASVKLLSPATGNARYLRFYPDNNNNDFRSYIASNGADIYLYRLEAAAAPTLGNIIGSFTDGTAIEDDGEYVQEFGTTMSFSALNAQSITIEDVNNNVVATGTDQVSYSPEIGENIYTVTATLVVDENTTLSQTIAFTLNVTEGTTAMGTSIVVRNNGEVVNYAENEVQNLYVQDVLTFYCKNADHICVSWTPGYGTYSNTTDSDLAEFPLGNLSVGNTWEIYVTAYQGTNSYSSDAVHYVLKAKLSDRAPLGDIIVKADGKEIVKLYDEDNMEIPFEIYKGAVITYECENADKYDLQDSAEGVYTADNPAGSSYIANALGRHSLQVTAGKTAYPGVKISQTFNFTVVEKPEDFEYTVVKAGDVIVPGQRYVLAGTGVSKADSSINVDYVMNTYDNGSSAKRITSVIPVNAIDYENGMLTMGAEEAHTYLTFEKADNKGFYAKLGDKYLAATLKTGGSIDNRISLIDEPSDLAYIIVDIDENNHALLKFAKSAEDIDNCAWIHLFSQKGSDSYWQCYTNHTAKKSYQLYKYDIAPIFDQIEEDATKVSFMAPKGELHVYTTVYDSEGNVVEEMTVNQNAPVMAAATNWTNKVADKNEVYEIAVPTTEGNVLKIQAKSVVNGLHSEEVVKNVDASGQVVAGVEAVIANSVAEGPVEYYNLQGVRVSGNEPGLYIRRQADKVEKVLVK